MAANRKLQSEIDRTLKKVQEGVEIFDEIWEKVYNAQNQNQKEKFESELKSQIKKLQRYRDDIKTWITNSDIKDKRPLTDARKLIETEMERFKVCEKEFKTKAFSKEGLASAPKEDPKEKERNKIRKWIAEKLEQLSSQTDAYEVEIESLSSSSKKKKKDNSTSKWEDLIERCRLHEAKLEVVLRLIDNETLSAEDVEPIMEQLDYLLEQMVEGNLDEVDSIDDESIYEELGLDDLTAPSREDDAAPEPVVEKATAPKEEKGRKGRDGKDEDDRKGRKEKSSAAEPVMLPSINATAMKAPPPKPSSKEPAKPVGKQPAAPAPGIPAVQPAARTKAATQVPLTSAQPARAARVAAPGAAVLPPPTPALPGQTEAQGLFARAAMVPPAQPAAERRPGKDDAVAAGPAGLAGAQKPCGLPPPHSAAVAQTAGLPPPPARSGPLPSNAGLSASGLGAAGLPGAGLTGGLPSSGIQGGGLPSALGGVEAAAKATGAVDVDPQVGASSPARPVAAAPDLVFGNQAQLTAGGDDADAGAAGSHTARPQLPAAQPMASSLPAAPGPGADAAAFASLHPEEPESYEERLGDLGSLSSLPGTPIVSAPSLPAGVQSSSHEEQAQILQMLNLSLLNMPEPSDSERPKTYVPRNPYPTPSSFPQTPAPVFDSPAIFEKFDVDTLFFIFYYQQAAGRSCAIRMLDRIHTPGTYQQYLAARELKKQSWRYHKKYLTWFQRHEEPKVTAEEYEQGTYVYFDYETGWCQRIKSEFTFEYGFLEDELQV